MGCSDFNKKQAAALEKLEEALLECAEAQIIFVGLGSSLMAYQWSTVWALWDHERSLASWAKRQEGYVVKDAATFLDSEGV